MVTLFFHLYIEELRAPLFYAITCLTQHHSRAYIFKCFSYWAHWVTSLWLWQFLHLLTEDSCTIFDREHSCGRGQCWSQAVITLFTFIELLRYEDALHGLLFFVQNSSCSGHRTDPRSFRWLESFHHTSEQKNISVVSLPRSNLESRGHKRTVDILTLNQNTLISTCHNSYVTVCSPTVGIQYFGTFMEADRLKSYEVLVLESGTSQDGLIKIPGLNLKVTSSVNNKLSVSSLKCLAVNRGSLPDFLHRFKIMKGVRSLTEKDSVHCPINDLRTVNQSSKHRLLGTLYLTDTITLIKMETSVFQLTNISPKHNKKALRRSDPMKSDVGFPPESRAMIAMKCSSSPTMS